jgi:hypothetical protein
LDVRLGITGGIRIGDDRMGRAKINANQIAGLSTFAGDD